MPIIQLYEIDNDYIDYLRQFDSKVLNHSGTDIAKLENI